MPLSSTCVLLSPEVSMPVPSESPLRILLIFLRLGLTSFGGPVAHLGLFRTEFVARRGWLSDADYADLVALCQFLPGPASSQVGFVLGLRRGGIAGALAAFAGFTLPSALIMTALALGVIGAGTMTPALNGALQGLRLVAVAIVAQAVWAMGRSLCPDGPRLALAWAAVALGAVLPGTPGMIGALLIGAGAGAVAFRSPGAAPAGATCAAGPAVSRRLAAGCLIVFAALLGGLPLLAGLSPGLALFEALYRSGALVFGGGHVVLPLMESALVQPGLLDTGSFLAGYGAAQAMPGPLFTLAAWVGAAVQGPGGAAIGTLAIFLPGGLILLGVLPFWDMLRASPRMQGAMQGANAAVVGILAAALHDPVMTSAIGDRSGLALALGALLLLGPLRVAPVAVVALGAACGAGLAIWGGVAAL